MLDNNKQGYKTLSHIWAAYIQHSKSAITSRRFYDMCASGCKYARWLLEVSNTLRPHLRYLF